MEPTNEQRIIEHLDRLNAYVVKQSSFPRIFLVGIIYGVGFFLGSAILATIALGIAAPFFGEIDWIRDSFMRGASFENSTSTP